MLPPLTLLLHTLSVLLPHSFFPWSVICDCSYDLMVRLQLGIRHSIGRMNQSYAVHTYMGEPGRGGVCVCVTVCVCVCVCV